MNKLKRRHLGGMFDERFVKDEANPKLKELEFLLELNTGDEIRVEAQTFKICYREGTGYWTIEIPRYMKKGDNHAN